MSGKPKFHMVRSVKGGSGKTAFALRTVVDLARKEKKVLYIDADVHASETYSRMYKEFNGEQMKEIIGGNTGEVAYFIDFSYGKNKLNGLSNKHYLNSYIHPYRGYYSKLEEIMLPAKLTIVRMVEELVDQSSKPELSRTIGNIIHFIFPDPSSRGRAVFGNIFQSSGKSAIGVGAYVAKMKSLLSYVCERGFTDVVVDMPPGSDTFSDHLSEIIIEMVKDKCDLAIYCVSNDDISHLHSSVSEAITYLHQSRTAYINEVYLVCNDGRESEKVAKYFIGRTTLTEFLKKVLKGDAKVKTDASIGFELGRLNYKRFSRDPFYYNCQRENYGTLFSLDKRVEDLPKDSSAGSPKTESTDESIQPTPAGDLSGEVSM